MNAIRCDNLKLCYGNRVILDKLKINIKEGKIISIIGPNGSGKSTLLKAMGKLLDPKEGKIIVGDLDIAEINMKNFAKKIAMLLQKNICPQDIKVEDLVFYGRIPHKKWYERKNSKDSKIVDLTMKQTGIFHLKDKCVFNLSGGESQRVWLAMAIAQEPKILMLDEPTSFLDIGYQIELLDLIKNINKDNSTTIIMVLHDLNQALRYSDYIYIINKGKIYDYGKSREVINDKMLKDVYKVCAKIFYDENNLPFIVPLRKV